MEDQGILTCPGGTAIDLAAHLIRQHCGDIRAHKTLEYLLVNSVKPREQKAEKITLNQPNTYENIMLHQAIDYMRDNLASHITLKEVAEHVKTNPRQLHRIFVSNTNESSAHYWQKLRLDHSKKLLANTNDYITNIAIECGFSDASHFILWLKLFIQHDIHIPAMDWSVWLAIVVATCAIGLGYAAWNIGMIQGNITILVIASYFTPIISSLIAMFVLHSPLFSGKVQQWSP